MKKLLPFIIFVLSSFDLYAQSNLDSLLSIWQDTQQPKLSRVLAFREFIKDGFLIKKPDSANIYINELLAFGDTYDFPSANGHAYNLQGRAYAGKSNYAKALESYDKSLAAFKEVEDKVGIALNLSNMGEVYRSQGNYDSALIFQERALSLSREISDKDGISKSLINMGTIFLDQGNYPQSLVYYGKSLKIYEETGNKIGMARSLNNIGIIYYYQGNYPRALEYYERSFAIKEELGDKKGAALSLNNIGIIYSSQGQYEQAKLEYEKLLDIYEEEGNKSRIALCLNNIGSLKQKQENYKSALEYYKRALKIRHDIGDQHGIAASLYGIGSIYKEEKDHTVAIEYYNKALSIRKEINDKLGITVCMNGIGAVYLEFGNYTRAVDYCKNGFDLSLEVGTLEHQKAACNCLYQAYKRLNKSPEALLYYEKLQSIADSLKAEETVKNLQKMEFEKQVLQDSIADAEKERLVAEAHREEVRKKDKIRNIAVGSGFFFLLLASGLFGLLRFVKKSKAMLQIEKDRSESLLLNILPEEIAEELKEKGKTDARDHGMVSIIFTDFKGFTEASEKLTASELVTEINICFEAFDHIMDKYQVEKIKTIGDAYMAAGGLPVPSENSVKNTVLAALEMQNFIASRKLKNEGAEKPAFEMRVGIHTGPIVAGIVGVKKFQYDIWGDTVNTASRMESKGQPGKVNISQATYELLQDDQEFAFVNRGKISAKGKGEMEMWFVELAR